MIFPMDMYVLYNHNRNGIFLYYYVFRLLFFFVASDLFYNKGVMLRLLNAIYFNGNVFYL